MTKAEVVSGSVALTFAPSIGVMLAYLVHSLTGGRGKLSKLVEGGGTALAATFMLYSGKLLLQETLEEHDILSTPSSQLILLLWIGLGIVLVGIVSHFASHTKSSLIFFIMLMHTAAEGAAIGTLIGSDSFAMVLLSLVVHNVPEGYVAGVVGTQEKQSLAAASALSIVSHLPQPTFLLLFAATNATNIFAESVTLALQGISAGSILATCFVELFPDAIKAIGIVKTALVSAACAIVLVVYG